VAARNSCGLAHALVLFKVDLDWTPVLPIRLIIPSNLGVQERRTLRTVLCSSLVRGYVS
jgi:hypothetical protein